MEFDNKSFWKFTTTALGRKLPDGRLFFTKLFLTVSCTAARRSAKATWVHSPPHVENRTRYLKCNCQTKTFSFNLFFRIGVKSVQQGSVVTSPPWDKAPPVSNFATERVPRVSHVWSSSGNYISGPTGADPAEGRVGQEVPRVTYSLKTPCYCEKLPGHTCYCNSECSYFRVAIPFQILNFSDLTLTFLVPLSS